MEKLTTIIITFNEERNIGGTIDAALKVSDEIIVMDSGSTDGTKDICLQKAVSFFQQEWPGYGAQRNHAVSEANNKYILVLDADEVLSESLISSILLLKQEGFKKKVYRLKRLNYYYGKFIRHGMENPDLKARLYHKDFASWDSKPVHEDLQFSADIKPKTLDGFLCHYTYRTISEHVLKADKYTSLAARDLFDRGKKRPGFIKLIGSPAFTFFNAFILKAGFLDGWHGWILAKMHANGALLKYAKLRMIYEEADTKSKQ
jgi:glycosyltransferase involved in cell wall biosynthesis